MKIDSRYVSYNNRIIQQFSYQWLRLPTPSPSPSNALTLQRDICYDCVEKLKTVTVKLLHSTHHRELKTISVIKSTADPRLCQQTGAGGRKSLKIVYQNINARADMCWCCQANFCYVLHLMMTLLFSNELITLSVVSPVTCGVLSST